MECAPLLRVSFNLYSLVFLKFYSYFFIKNFLRTMLTVSFFLVVPQIFNSFLTNRFLRTQVLLSRRLFTQRWPNNFRLFYGATRIYSLNYNFFSFKTVGFRFNTGLKQFYLLLDSGKGRLHNLSFLSLFSFSDDILANYLPSFYVSRFAKYSFLTALKIKGRFFGGHFPRKLIFLNNAEVKSPLLLDRLFSTKTFFVRSIVLKSLFSFFKNINQRLKDRVLVFHLTPTNRIISYSKMFSFYFYNKLKVIYAGKNYSNSFIIVFNSYNSLKYISGWLRKSFSSFMFLVFSSLLLGLFWLFIQSQLFFYIKVHASARCFSF